MFSKGILHRLKGLIDKDHGVDDCTLTAEPVTLQGKIRLSCEGGPAKLVLGKQPFCLYPAFNLVTSKRRKCGDWLLVDPERCASSQIAGFIRIKAGETVVIGRENSLFKTVFDLSKPIRKRHLEIRNRGGDLVLTKMEPEAKTFLSLPDDANEIEILKNRRHQNLKNACEILGCPIELLSTEQALADVEKVNAILGKEVYRKKNSGDRPGGLLRLPDDLNPIIIGDVHARNDNLLKILSENSFLEEVADGSAYFLFLGDLVHSETEDELEEMDSSLLTLDLFCKLKIRFPENVFWLRGNHDSFDDSVGKGGVPQGLILKQRARELRGQEYVDQLTLLFKQLPYVAKTHDFIACHAAPTRSQVSAKMLVDIDKYPGLAHEISWNRIYKSNNPTGYGKRAVKLFRSSLGVDRHTPFIVGHSRQSQHETYWMNAGEIKNLHVLFSANPDNLAVFIRVGHEMVPLEYSAEPLVSFVNAPEKAVSRQDAPAEAEQDPGSIETLDSIGESEVPAV